MTKIYHDFNFRDHAQLAGELAEAREISRQYETTIREMCAEIEKRAPQFAQQKKLFEQSYDENVHLVRLK